MSSIVEIKRLGQPLFSRLYMVGIRYKDTLSVDDIKAHGMPTTGDAKIDQAVHNDLVDRYITIDKMVDHFKQGTSFYIRNPKETEEIYQVIHAYLIAWKQFLAVSINLGEVPVEDLIHLDRLAGKIYDHAVEHFPQEELSTPYMRDLFRNGTGRATLTQVRSVHQGVLKPEDVKRHESLSELFSKATFSRPVY